MSLNKLIVLVIATSLLFVSPAVGSNDGVTYFPISDITVSPGDPNFVYDDTGYPITEITEFWFYPPYIISVLYEHFNIHNVPVWAAETIGIIVGILTTIATVLTSGYVLFLYTRRKLSEDPTARHMIILAYLKEHPGSQQTEIVQATGYSRGSISYNLKRLQQELKIYKKQTDVVRYYPAGAYPTEKDSLAWRLLENETRQNIFQIILSNPGISQQKLSNEMKIPITTLRWHLDKLKKGELITVEVQRHATKYSVNPLLSQQYNFTFDSLALVC